MLLPVDYVVDPAARSRFNIYDYRLKSTEASRVQVRCPPDLPRDVTARLRALSRLAVRALGVRDLGRIDFRIGEDGRIYLLEVNALPSLERGASLFAAAAREGLDYEAALGAIVASAGRRQGLMAPAGRAPAPAGRHRCASASPTTSSASTPRAATTPRPSTTRPRPSTPSATRWRATATW